MYILAFDRSEEIPTSLSSDKVIEIFLKSGLFFFISYNKALIDSPPEKQIIIFFI